MKKILYAILVCLTLFFTACEEYLSVAPKGEFVPSTIEEYKALMISQSMQGRFTEFLQIMSDQVIIDDASFASVRLNQAPRYIWADYVDATASEGNEIWQKGYARIFVFNNIIEAVEGNKVEGDEVDVKELEAMARAGRAYEYFDLVNAFGKTYNSSSSSDLSVPLVVVSDINADIPDRATVSDVYDFMLNELTASLPNLPAEGNPLYPSKRMAYAMLARIYLFMGDYTKASESADMALALNNTIYDYNNTPFPDLHKNDETIYVKYNYLYIGSISYAPWTKSGFALASDFLSLFEANDIRNNFFTSPMVNNDGYNYIANNKWLANPNYLVNAINNIGLQVPELYLIKSECNARLQSGSVQAIIDDLNALRVKRHVAGTYTDLTTTDIPDFDTALDFVLDERRRELAFDDMRLFDMRRLMVLGEYGSISRTVNGVTYTMTPSSNNWVMNIPLKVMDYNNDWEQNLRDGVSF